ncbi:MAG: PASTA domain-containing protein [Porphyromonadaceae bacterium]|nr:PASTA domain-containing protein [Porphyromonadaceae bacterium]
MIKNNSILKHLFLMVVASILILFGIMWGLKLYTRHQDNVQVPNIVGKTLNEAYSQLERTDLRYEIVDSVYDKGQRPGTVAELTPAAGASVKPGRIIFIKTYASSPMRYSIPYVKDMSVRQARALLRGLGFDNITERIVPGEHLELCVGLQHRDGRPIEAGAMIAKETPIVMLITGIVRDTLSTGDLIEDYEYPNSDSTMRVRPAKQDTTDTPDDWW